MMKWWDKIGLFVDIWWLVVLLFMLVGAFAIAIMEMRAKKESEQEEDEQEDEYKDPLKEEYLEDITRERENMNVERRGWKSINEDLRRRIDILQSEKVSLQIERNRLKLQLDTLQQKRNVTTVEDLQAEAEELHMRLEEYLCGQDEILAAYTTGNLMIENTDKQQEKVELLGKAEASLGDTIVYLTRAKKDEKQQ